MNGALPDWGAAIPDPGGLGWLVRGQPARARALPTGLALQREDGRPGYAIECFLVTGDGEPQMFGVLAMRFVGEHAIEARQAALAQTLPGVRLEPLPVSEALVRFVAAEALDLGELAEFRPTASAGSGARLSVRLDPRALHTFRQIALTGVTPIRAEMVLLVPGAATRIAARAKVDGDRLLALLDQGGAWSRVALVEALKSGALASAVELEVVEESPQAIDRAIEALVDRLCANGLAPAPETVRDGHPVWRPVGQALAGRRATLDLSDETVAPRAFLLASPPLLAPEFHEAEMAVESDPQGITTGFHLVTVDANLPARRVGAVAIGLEIEAPAAPPDRPQSIRRTVRFDNASGIAAIPLRLSPREALRFECQSFVIAMVGGAPERLLGERFVNDDSHLTVPPAAFAVEFVRAEATAALLRHGKVAIAWSGTRGSANWRATAELTAASPSVAVARPRDCTELEAGAELVAGDGATKLAIASVGAGDLWLDLSMLAEAGPRSATLEARFAEGDAGIAIEYVGEDATADTTAAQMRRLTRASPSVTLGWLPVSPFRSGYCLRWVRADGGRGPWSPPFPAGSRIALEPGRAATDAWPGAAASEPESPVDEDALDTSGLALIAAGPGEYVLRPLAPRIQIGPDGKPALQLIVAGSTGFLQLTAEWTVDAARIADLSAAIERRDGVAPRLSPAPDEVRDTALLLVPEGGGETILATGTALGVAPQTSQLAATLDAAQIALIQRGIAGERGVVKIRYRIDAGDPTRAEGSFAEVDGGAGVGTMTAMRESVGEIHRHVIEITADLADALNVDPNG